ncbi:hypothetical protein LTR53_004450 [Teratosphaeriaceae sp. CCFEE 6253]|nr:hypothetical protein LTR53_004450 [Teratosphaeriaceae sp. CCFEE 6253]
MPVTTRSGRARDQRAGLLPPSSTSGMQSGRQQASRAGPSRVVAGPSRTGRQQAATAFPAASSPPGDSSDDDSDEADPDEDQAQDTTGQPANAQNVIRQRQARIYEALSAFNEDGLSPRGFAATIQTNLTPATQLARYLAGALTRLVRDDNDLATLQAFIRVPGPQWSAQLAQNLNRRRLAIMQGLQDSAAGTGGQDVVRTIEAFREIFNTIDDTRRDYFEHGMDVVYRRQLASLLVTTLGYIVANNEDIYLATNRPAYAGEATRNERRLFSCFMAEQSQPAEFLNVLGRAGPYLAHEGGRIRAIHARVQQYIDGGLAGGVDHLRLQWMAANLGEAARSLGA